MMKRNLLAVVMIALVFGLSVTFLTGCAKKATMGGGQAAMTQEQRAAAEASSMAASASQEEAAAREKALREQALREQAEKAAAEKAVAEKAAAERAAKEAAAKGAAAKTAAVIKELQIPDIFFDFDKYNLKPLAQTTLKNGAPAYLRYKEYKLVIEGHCDERGTAEYNLALGQKRADEAARYLTDLGIEKERVKTISYGKEMPLDKGNNEEAWAKNRRDHFVVFPPVK
jgi:peptidoglycan-associated lipoprotein